MRDEEAANSSESGAIVNCDMVNEDFDVVLLLECMHNG